jgi:hypothetical protein
MIRLDDRDGAQITLSPGHIPQIVPTAKLVSITELPSRGSKATEYPLPPRLSIGIRVRIRKLRKGLGSGMRSGLGC